MTRSRAVRVAGRAERARARRPQALGGEPVGRTWLRDGRWARAVGPRVLAVRDEPVQAAPDRFPL